jgi:Protein of unknown function (DUF2892)
MKTNVGNLDKNLRILLGVVIASFGLYFQSWWGMIAIIPLATSLTGICPLYSLLGINTCKSKFR